MNMDNEHFVRISGMFRISLQALMLAANDFCYNNTHMRRGNGGRNLGLASSGHGMVLLCVCVSREAFSGCGWIH
jgi:hypothetical protein